MPKNQSDPPPWKVLNRPLLFCSQALDDNPSSLHITQANSSQASRDLLGCKNSSLQSLGQHDQSNPHPIKRSIRIHASVFVSSWIGPIHQVEHQDLNCVNGPTLTYPFSGSAWGRLPLHLLRLTRLLGNVPLDLSLLYCNFSNSFFQVWVPVSTNLSKDNPTRNAFWGFGCFILKGCKLRVGQESAKFHTLQNEIRIHVPRKQNKPKNLGLQCLHQPFHLVSTESKEHLWSWQVNGLYFLPVSISTLGTYTTYTCTC